MAQEQIIEAINRKYKEFNLDSPSAALPDILREFDRLYDIVWPPVHLNTARHYLDSKGENQVANGGSEWKNSCTRSSNSVNFSLRYRQKKRQAFGAEDKTTIKH